MAWEHQKSGVTVFLDVLRHVLALSVDIYVTWMLWRWNWVAAVVALVPLCFLMVGMTWVITLPLYALTPENRAKGKMLQSMNRGDAKTASALADEFSEKFKVNEPNKKP